MSIAKTENSSNLMCLLYQAQTTHTQARATVREALMPRFYFDLASRNKHIRDRAGKELANLTDAYAHARKLIDKILFHLGYDDVAAWKVVISNDEHDARMIVPFPASAMFRNQRRGTG
jgi:hypothetical protein